MLSTVGCHRGESEQPDHLIDGALPQEWPGTPSAQRGPACQQIPHAPLHLLCRSCGGWMSHHCHWAETTYRLTHLTPHMSRHRHQACPPFRQQTRPEKRQAGNLARCCCPRKERVQLSMTPERGRKTCCVYQAETLLARASQRLW
jgi:hypothetical protein